MLDQLPTILALMIALAFLVRPEPWSVLTILARRLIRIDHKWFNVNFVDERRSLSQQAIDKIGSGEKRVPCERNRPQSESSFGA